MKYDVVVVGAGPAGSTAAKYLAEKGVKTLLIDKESFPRDKPCGGGLPTRVMKQFPYIEDFIDSISYGSVTHSSSLKYKLDFVREKPLLVTVLRKDFDYRLVKIAIEKGVVFIDGKTVTDIKNLKNKPKIVLNDGQEIESKIVIGCDGMRSIVAEKAQLSEKTDDFCICLIQEQPMSTKQLDQYFTKKRMMHLFIKTQGIAGYGWIFPKKKSVNVGMGEFESAADAKRPKPNFKEIYAKYIDTLKENKILPSDFKIENLKGATIPVFPLKKTYADHVLLCGDAAGFINPITGEGIYYAMVSGEIAADVVAEALNAHDASEEFLSRYQKIWKDEFGKDLKVLGRFNNQWGKSSERFVRLLSKDRKFAKLMIGVTGGRISISKYKWILILRFLYVSLKDLFSKK